NAAIGRVQLKMLDAWNSRRAAIARIYRNILPAHCLMKEQDGSRPANHLFVIKTEKRDLLAKHLDEGGISTGIHYPTPIHKQDAYMRLGFGGSFPVAELFARKIISIPIFPSMTNDEARYVAESVNEVVS
ncbi:MAG: DegT/DnrJ/EryC1/StrS family aminotransferase, partial [Candidatus Aenigmarchaeota archaeon]|nr:DegT/DnrJ/EryC1/StrS family aminotransferase [Candidatus Aenigmarchaeota archaeon]